METTLLNPPNELLEEGKKKDFARPIALQKKAAWPAVITFMLIMAAVARFFLMDESLRLDEAQSLWQTDRSLSGVMRVVARDVHMPLYHVLLFGWQKIFGNQVAAVRIFSLIFSLAAIPAIYLLGKKFFTRPVALYASGLAALSPFLNWYGNEIRMYSLFVFLSVWNHYAFLSLFDAGEKERPEAARPRAAWAGYIVTLFLGVYTHYFFWLIFFSQMAFFLLYRRNFPAKAFQKFAAAALGALFFILPWVYWVWHIGEAGNSQPLLFKPGTLDLFNALFAYFFGFHSTFINAMMLASWPIVVLLLFFGLQKNKTVPKAAVYFLMSAALPLLAAFSVSFIRPVFAARYLIFVVPSLYLFISWLFSTYSRKMEFGFKALVAALMAVMLVSQSRGSNVPVKENYQAASDLVTKYASASDIVAVSAPFTVYPFEYYYRGKARVITVPMWDRLARGPIPPYSPAKMEDEADKLKAVYSRVWLVMSYDQGYGNEVHTYFETHFQREFEKEVSPGITVYAYRLRYDGLSAGYQ